MELINNKYVHFIKKILLKYNGKYLSIDNDESLKKIYKLFKNNIKFNAKTDIEMLYYSEYHHIRFGHINYSLILI